jgi:VanZ family protein
MGELNDSRTKLPLVLWIGSALFIVYGTTIPFNFVSSRAVAYEHWTRVVWNPLISPDTGTRVPIPDFVANVLLFTPFGCFGMWALRRPRHPWGKVVVLALLSVMLSVSVEAVQLFTVDRVSSLADVVANTMGGVIGAIGGIVLSASAISLIDNAAQAGLTDAAAFFPLVVAALVVCAGAWEPFDVTIDFGGLIAKVREFAHDPVQFGVFSDEGVSLLQHLLFGATLFVWLKQARVRSAARNAAGIGVVVALACEGGQLFISSRMPGAWDVLVGVVGVLAGVAAGVDLWRSRRSPTPGRWCVGLFWLTAIGVALQQLSPFTVTHAAVRPFQWMPFLNYHAFTTVETVSHSAELLLSYLPLGFGLAVAVRNGPARFALVTTLVLTIAVPVEALQRFIGDRLPDVTDIGLSVAGAWLGLWIATTGWALFREQIRLLNERPTRERPRTNRIMLQTPFVRPLSVLALALGLIVMAIKVVLRLPGIPYNVSELFLDQASLGAVIFFALTILWIGGGSIITARILTSVRRPYLYLPIVVVGVSLVSKMLISRGVTYESLDDILGSNNIFGLVTEHVIWGNWWRGLFLHVGVDVVDFVERRVRYCALYSIPLIVIAFGLLPHVSKNGLRRRAAGVTWAATAFVAALWLWASGAIVLTGAATDNLTELIADHGPLGIPGPVFLLGVLAVLAANVALVLAARLSPARWLLAMLASAIGVALTWTLLNAGLEQHVNKYSFVFSGVQFLLGPDRQHQLTTTALFARWATVYIGAVTVIAVGAWIVDNVAAAVPATLRESAAPEAS